MPLDTAFDVRECKVGSLISKMRKIPSSMLL